MLVVNYNVLSWVIYDQTIVLLIIYYVSVTYLVCSYFVVLCIIYNLYVTQWKIYSSTELNKNSITA